MHDLGAHFEGAILAATGASSLRVAGEIQSLWSGYGKILRLTLEGSSHRSVVAKHVRTPTGANHPRGWNSDASHQRKLRSYQVETAWYRDWRARCDTHCRVPHFLAAETRDDETLIVLEDLDAAGFPARRTQLGWGEIETCIAWLAQFHATFMAAEPSNLWEVGTYWHLDTRADELAALDDPQLKAAAGELDARLRGAAHQTLVHGDAKLANFCFSEDGQAVAAVDFQYVGGGCGMKDLAYFIGSCLDETECEKLESELLECYFRELRLALAKHRPDLDAGGVIAEWRGLYHLAWVDFHRFLKGWSPGHWKINSYSERLAREVLAAL